MSDIHPVVASWHTPTTMVLGGAVSPPTTSNLQQQLRDLDDKHDTAHDRLRKDVDALAIELSSARELAVAVRNDLNVAIARQTNISAIGFSTNQVIAVVVTALALAGGFYKLAQNQAETTAAIQRLQTDSTRSIERQELQRQQIESLQNAVLLQKGTK